MKQKKVAADPGDDEKCSASDQDVEILKAVAQAWYSRSGGSNSNPTSEYDAPRRRNSARPSRFRIEAASSNAKNQALGSSIASSGSWDFRKSLLDSYEIVTVSKKLEERGISLDGDDDVSRRRLRRESENSLRNLLNRISSSKRFTV